MDERIRTDEGQSRRRFLKQMGTVAWATPFLVTMTSRVASAQGNQCGTQQRDPTSPIGVSCNTTTPCGTAQLCLPPLNDLGLGNSCYCEGV